MADPGLWERDRMQVEAQQRQQERSTKHARDLAPVGLWISLLVVMGSLSVFAWAHQDALSGNSSDSSDTTAADSAPIGAPPADSSAPQSSASTVPTYSAPDTDSASGAESFSSSEEDTTPAASGPSPQVHVYCLKVGAIAHELEAALRQFGVNNTKVGEDPSLLYTQDWRISQAAALVVMKHAADEFSAIADVPPEAQDVQVTANEMADELRDVVAEYTDAVDAQDVAGMLASLKHMRRDMALASELADDMKRLNTP